MVPFPVVRKGCRRTSLQRHPRNPRTRTEGVHEVFSPFPRCSGHALPQSAATQCSSHGLLPRVGGDKPLQRLGLLRPASEHPLLPVPSKHSSSASASGESPASSLTDSGRLGRDFLSKSRTIGKTPCDRRDSRR